MRQFGQLVLLPLAFSVLVLGCGASSGGGGPYGDDTKDDTGSGDTYHPSDVPLGWDTKDANGPETTLPPLPDEDGDGISNEDEGDGNVDTDNDGIPDSADDDSDNDGIPDAREAGDSDTNTPPVDSDGDNIPDFRDDDSDGNGIPDSQEGQGDIDGDNIPDFQDTDNDGDGIHDALEIEGGAGDCNHDGTVDPPGTPANPWDCDGDGMADYLTQDSDGDGISDRAEGISNDTDGDGFLDRYDDDSDGDGIPDATEAGDASLDTPPQDTDGDFIPDFRDPDSDNDGVSDAQELANNTNPRDEDTDNDGASDLIEVTAGTDPVDASDNPQANGDFVFLIPYEQPTAPVVDTLEFATSIQFADIYFGFDTTGSMAAELDAMANSTSGVPAIIDQLACTPTGGSCQNDEQCAVGVCFDGTCIQDPSAGDGCIPDMWTGVARFDNVNSFTNIEGLQPSPSVTANAIPGTGGGGSEAIIQPSYCVANGGSGCSGCESSGIGCGGFRPEAIRIYVQITDADNQCSSCSQYTTSGAGAALLAAGIKFVALITDTDIGNTEDPAIIHRAIGIASGTVDSSGQPFVYEALDSAVVSQAVSAIRAIARGVPLNVTIGQSELPDDDGDALRFIDYLEVNTSGTGNCTNVPNTLDTDSDGHKDSFPSLLPGTPICWDVHPIAVNSLETPGTEPMLFKARLTVYGDGSPLDSRDVFFLLPPDIGANTN